MKKIFNQVRPEYSIIKVRFLILIYALLCILTVLFSRNFFVDTLQNGKVPERLSIIVFFTIPAVLLIVLGASIFSLFIDLILRRPGSKFNARLLIYFTLIVFFSIAPITIMTSTALNEIVRFWHDLDAPASTRAANSFAAENYSLHMERFESILKQNDFSRITPGSKLPLHIASIQLFADNNSFFTGDEQFRMELPPSIDSGFPPREIPRDIGTIRYVLKQRGNSIRVISYNLGSDFDRDLAALENQAERFDTINLLRQNIHSLLIFYYVVFFLPTLLMTVIIAISFTKRITQPIVELTEATRKVAEGDFSIQILSRRNDELGLLIRSFNAMVQDLEKTRAALVKNEKISIWQNMAQQLAHEIKNPLTPIKLSAERLLRRWQNDPKNIGEILECSVLAIIQETESLAILLNEFRTLSKPMEPSKVWAKLGESIEEVINSYSTSYPSVNFDINYTEKELLIKIEKNRLSQILTNLIINAIDSMNGQGSIDIRTDLVKKLEISYCRISIKDSGNGISEQERHRIFTPYFTSKESGTGLGLPIVERIINDHGGAIWFDSAEGAGTTFYIDLPAEKSNNGEQ
ncbi:MAG: HAMP domain-containing protein [Treponema sp.]|jgi:nitrogen fixation/metabolism regulation signal transduction histidine kinase|nr:HAMP domain-containing protein [Treponema sp.]